MKKILKKVAATILAASMVIGMTACGTGGGGSSTQGGTSSNKSGKIKIGVSIWSSTYCTSTSNAFAASSRIFLH